MSTPIERAIVFDCAGESCVGIVHDAAAGQAAVGVLVVVGGPQYRVGSHRQFVHLARHLAAAGRPVLRFDYRGMGDSGGEQRDFRVVGTDIRAALDAFLAAVPGLRSVVIFGLCDAASAALLSCRADPRVAGMILANPWVRTESGLARAHVKHYYGSRLLQGTFWRKLWSGRFDLRGAVAGFLRAASRAFGGGKLAATDAAGDFVAAMRGGLQDFTGPVLLLLSGRDLTAREFTDLCGRDAAWARSLARPGVTTVHLPDADHTFSSRAATAAVNAACERWIAAKVVTD
jgi:exosortase A-associated hydrolase 1